MNFHLEGLTVPRHPSTSLPNCSTDDVGRSVPRYRPLRRVALLLTAATLSAGALSAPAAAEVGSLSTGTGSGGGQFGAPLESLWRQAPDQRNTPFYTDPAPLEGAPGRVIRTEDAPMRTTAAGDALSAVGSTGAADAAGFSATSERVLYESTDAYGAPLATSGLYLRNDRPADPRHGERPLVVLSPGTQGLGDHCAPSKTMPQVLDLQVSPGIGIGLGYEIGQAHFFLARGFNVFVPDFQGTGTQDDSTYLTRDAMAHATLDGARAAQNLPDSGLPAEPKVGLFGHSQGGGATAAAAELASEYSPELNIVGAAASGPPADLLATADVLDGGANAGILGFLTAGLSAAYPDRAEALRGIFNETGLEMVDRTAESCVGESIGAYGFADSRQWTKDGRSFTENIRTTPELNDLFNSQRIGLRAPAMPVAVLQEPNDDIVPQQQVKQMAADWCERGAQVEYLEGFLPPILPGSAAVHMSADLHPKGADWLSNRVADGPVVSTCQGA